VIPKDDIYVPSAFTPNNNGRNDVFKPSLSLQYSINAFRIYNRWGQVIYHTSTRDEGWNGKVDGILQDSNIFIWTLKVTNRKGKIVEKSGTVLLIR
jgi:gliding motility-associated-like protein